jgi:hypothetical protein
MKHGDDARIEESNNLRLALATFALQLDAFEVRIQDGSPAVSGLGSLSPRGPIAVMAPERKQ